MMPSRDGTYSAIDRLTAVQARISGEGETRVASKCLLLNDDFNTTTLDGERWIPVSGSGGGYAPANGYCTLSTSTNTAGQGNIDSRRRLAPFTDTSLLAVFLVQFGTVPVASNKREFGIRNDGEDTYATFELDGTTFQAVHVDAGAHGGSTKAISTITPADMTWFWASIEYSQRAITWMINGASVHTQTIVGEGSPLMEENAFRVFAKTKNSGSAVNNTMNIAEVGAYLLGDVARGPTRSIAVSYAADTQITRGPAYLERIYMRLNQSQQWTIRDGVAGGRVVMTKNVASPVGVGLMLEVGEYFADGIYFDHASGSADSMTFFVRT